MNTVNILNSGIYDFISLCSDYFGGITFMSLLSLLKTQWDSQLITIIIDN